MNKKEICFITCVNDETLYERAASHIDMLYLPRDYTVTKIAIRDALSMTSGYNTALKQSNAKYKVYLHQDTMIINRMFLHDLLFLFENHPSLGMFGVIGAKDLPENSVWWDSKLKAGKILEKRDTYGYLSFIEADYAFQTAAVIDGVLMATQYDIPWEEQFDGWHFYDVSQSFLFQNKGYEVGIAHQPHPWVMHECGEEFDQLAYGRYLHQFHKWQRTLSQ
ncbi:glycosyltransferase family protein [Shouchella sp. JSM 1781072]|uniref:glycosyltransferase family protein n=1 Tax=Bacillaceae TaxID=186817 RepID=UPI000C06C263|nr:MULTISPECIES: glycosyltransferase family protein [Bacillaceae]UTR05547.1 glycosyltransferase family protein [Alkalihalobacillus sp. LMS6]